MTKIVRNILIGGGITTAAAGTAAGVTVSVTHKNSNHAGSSEQLKQSVPDLAALSKAHTPTPLESLVPVPVLTKSIPKIDPVREELFKAKQEQAKQELKLIEGKIAQYVGERNTAYYTQLFEERANAQKALFELSQDEIKVSQEANAGYKQALAAIDNLKKVNQEVAQYVGKANALYSTSVLVDQANQQRQAWEEAQLHKLSSAEAKEASDELAGYEASVTDQANHLPALFGVHNDATEALTLRQGVNFSSLTITKEGIVINGLSGIKGVYSGTTPITITMVNTFAGISSELMNLSVAGFKITGSSKEAIIDTKYSAVQSVLDGIAKGIVPMYPPVTYLPSALYDIPYNFHTATTASETLWKLDSAHVVAVAVDRVWQPTYVLPPQPKAA